MGVAKSRMSEGDSPMCLPWNVCAAGRRWISFRCVPVSIQLVGSDLDTVLAQLLGNVTHDDRTPGASALGLFVREGKPFLKSEITGTITVALGIAPCASLG